MPDHSRDLSRLLDTLIPGDARWPSATRAGVTAATVAAEDATAGAWATTLADADAAALTRTEQAEPQRFRALLAAVYRAYYTTPAAQAVIAAIANAAPREPSPFFDESLLARVIATQAGKRRL